MNEHIRRKRPRLYFAGLGRRETLSATRLLTEAALLAGLEAISDEIGGGEQIESATGAALLIGGWPEPSLTGGKADIILSFAPLETLRALPRLCAGGAVFSSIDPIPLSASPGNEGYPDLMQIMAKTNKEAHYAHFISCDAMGKQAGAQESGPVALLGAVCASGLAPIPLKCLERTIAKFFSGKDAETNLVAMRLGAKSVPYPVKIL